MTIMTGAPLVQRRGRWKNLQLGCAPLVAVLVAVFVCAGLTLAGRSAPTPEPPASTPTGTVVAIDGSAAVGTDGRTILLSGPDACLTPSLTAVETDSRVTLTLTETDDFLAGCATVVVARRGIAEVPLRAPLGGRELVDAVSGRPVPHLSETDVLWPRKPMAGWISDPYGEVSTGMAYFGGPGAAVLVENYIANGTQGRLTIVQTDGGWHPPPGTATRPLTVRGHPGLAGRGVIVWPESGHTVAVIGVRSVPPTPAQPGAKWTEPPGSPDFIAPDEPLTTAELLAIAATLTNEAP